MEANLEVPGPSNPASVTGSEDLCRSEVNTPSTNEEQAWKGWAELENDPIVFSTLLVEWGVQGIQVREVIPLDAIFDVPASSTFGLILLSRYVAFTPPEDSDTVEKPPPDLWFANQTSTFSCATVALMNIINNRPEVNLGSLLSEFCESTKGHSSKDRGHALDNFEHVRAVHNSFASRFDKMNVDLRLKEAAAEAAKKKASKSKKSRKKRVASVEEDDDDDDGFHFVAYVPACGRVWRMDGMQRNPQSLGDISDGDSWITMIVADVQSQWASGADGEFEFSLLSLVSGVDDSALQADARKMKRAREDWGPFISKMIKIQAEKGDVREKLE